MELVLYGYITVMQHRVCNKSCFCTCVLRWSCFAKLVFVFLLQFSSSCLYYALSCFTVCGSSCKKSPLQLQGKQFQTKLRIACMHDEANGMYIYRFERGGYRHGNRIWGNIPSSSMQNLHYHLHGTDIQITGFIVGIVFSAESFHVMYFSNKGGYVFFMCLHGRWVKYRVILLFHGLKPHISTQPLLNQSTGQVFLNIFYPRAISSPPQSAGNSDNSVLQNNLRDLFDAITQVKCLC